MNPTVLVVALVLVSAVAGKLLMRRFRTVSYTQIYCAIAACVAGFLLFVKQSSGPFWTYTGLFIGVIMGTFLVLVLLRRLDTPRSTGPV
jgi:ABC-type Mn2+/Zn2+ transport system permease subunit